MKIEGREVGRESDTQIERERERRDRFRERERGGAKRVCVIVSDR